MTERDLADFIAALEQFKREVTTREQALAVLQKEGLIGEDGLLCEHYRPENITPERSSR